MPGHNHPGSHLCTLGCPANVSLSVTSDADTCRHGRIANTCFSCAMAGEIRSVSSTGGQKGVKSARFDLIPIGPLTELAEHYGKGALKYANHQWRNGYEWGKSYAALQRHLTAFWGGEDYDTCPADGRGCAFETADGEPYTPAEPGTCYNHTGSHHMAAVAWHAFALLEFKDRFGQHDDRYAAGGAS